MFDGSTQCPVARQRDEEQVDIVYIHIYLFAQFFYSSVSALTCVTSIPAHLIVDTGQHSSFQDFSVHGAPSFLNNFLHGAPLVKGNT
jgi:hypothetical protein